MNIISLLPSEAGGDDGRLCSVSFMLLLGLYCAGASDSVNWVSLLLLLLLRCFE